MIIDFHTHNFPDALAPKAMESLKANCAANPDIVPHTDGTASDAKRLLSAAGVDRAVVCNIATNPRQESKVNSYAISLLESDFFIPLGSLHPDSEYKREELTRLKDAGIKGIKLIPQCLLYGINKCFCFFGGDFTRTVIHHCFVFEQDFIGQGN